MADKKEDDDKEKPLVVVTDNPKDLEESGDVDLPPKEEEEGKKKVASKEKDDDEEGTEEEGEEEQEEARLGHGEEEEDGKPRDRKSERRSRKERQRAARERQDRELGFLRKELERVDRDNMEMRKRLSGQETRSYDSKITELDRNIRDAEQIMKEALDAKNGADHTEAVRIRDQLVEAKRKLTEEKEEHEEAAKEEATRRPAPDPEAVTRGRQWMSGNPWFKTDQRGRPQGQDSRIAKAIDEAVYEDGFDPRTDEYWEELDKRIKQQLPHLKGRKKANDEDEDDERRSRSSDRDDDEQEEQEERARPKKRSGGPKFRVGGKERPLKPNEVYLPKERIDALKEAGLWDDPEERARYIKAYKNFDTEHPDLTTR